MSESQFISHLNPKKDFKEGVFLAMSDVDNIRPNGKYYLKRRTARQKIKKYQ